MRPLRLKPKIRPRDTLRGAKAAPKRTELDKLCRQVVFQRDQHCVRCGATSQLQWCHIHSRGFLCVRWNPWNSVVLCAKDHFWMHQHPIEGGKFLADHIGPSKTIALRAILKVGGTPDRLATKIGLLQMLKGGSDASSMG